MVGKNALDGLGEDQVGDKGSQHIHGVVADDGGQL